MYSIFLKANMDYFNINGFTLTIDGLKWECVEAIVEFMYSARITVTSENVYDLVECSDYFSMSGIETIFELLLLMFEQFCLHLTKYPFTLYLDFNASVVVKSAFVLVTILSFLNLLFLLGNVCPIFCIKD